MTVQTIDFFKRHWLDLADGKGIPERHRIDPAALAPVLPKVMILERSTRRTTQTTCRLMGTAIVERLGADYTHNDIFSHMGVQMQTLLESLVAQASDGVWGISGTVRGAFRGENEPSSPFLFLPVRPQSGKGCQMLGVFDLAPLPRQRAARPLDTLAMSDVLVVEIGLVDPFAGTVRERLTPGLPLAA